MVDLFKAQNLILEYHKGEDERPSRLYLGSEGEQWYFLDLEGARRLRDALDDGIAIMEGEN